MKRTLLLICTLLCANVLSAQSTFTIGDLTYGVISTNPPQVEVHDANLSITTANIPETVTYNETTYSVTSIEEWAFYNCSSLTSVTLPNSVASIGNDAFYKCSSLTSISIGNSLTYIGYDAFYNCSSLNTLNFNAINCNDFYNLSPFFDCPITTINIGDSVQRIPNHFAKELSSLTSVNIGNNVTSIGDEAFEGCSSLQNVTCLATTPPTLADNTVFPYPNIASLKVPCGSLEAYSSPTSLWNVFFAGRISESGYNVEVSVNDETFGSVAVESDCSTATLTATASEGYVFLSWNDGNTDNPRTVALTSDTSFTAIFALIDESSLSEDAEFAELSVYPNPTRGKVSFNQAIEKIEVIDLSGKTLQTYENANEINMETLPAGVYHLRMTIGDKTTTRKVIKE
ncbi:MAG: leucine-rich repeat domain-containing protein [Bacteroidales bacterium]|nr:leucine-rich repeat domain-containing protein [Bacteroidales bacterium]